MTTPQLQAARDLFGLLDSNAAKIPDGEPMADGSVAAMLAAGLYGVAAPREVGGDELSLVELLEVYAEISRADGSTGWCQSASAVGAAFFGAYCEADAVADVFDGSVPPMAGQFAPNGTATPLGGDAFILNGAYEFGSGMVHARWAGAGVIDESDGTYLFACMPGSSVEPKENWDVLGLQATASIDYELHDVEVPAGRTFDFFTPTRRQGGRVYDLGVLVLTAAMHAGFAIGVTRRAVDELAALAAHKTRMGAETSLADSEQFQVELGTLEGRARAAETFAHDVFGKAQHHIEETGEPDPKLDALCRQASVHTNQEGADIVRQVYLLGGTTSLRRGPIQRCFRDIHAGSQHFFAGTFHTRDLAKALLGEADAGAAGVPGA